MLEKVTAELLAESFLSDDFQKTLIKAGRITKRTGNETAFVSSLSPFMANFFDVTSISEGNCHSVKISSEEIPDGYLYLSDLHYHPSATGPIVPSLPDLSGISSLDGDYSRCILFSNNTYDYLNPQEFDSAIFKSSISSIAKLRGNGSIEVLTYGPSQMGLDLEHAEMVHDRIDEFLLDSDCDYDEDNSLGIINSDIGTNEVAEVLRNSGYCNAIVLEYPRDIKNSEGRKRFRESNLEEFAEKLKVFEKKIQYKKWD
tara:strand:- start:207 stop:977 length:771 start_codon:yes stop_codon:yes gene_type:complete